MNAPSPALAHMPFPHHRDCAQWDREDATYDEQYRQQQIMAGPHIGKQSGYVVRSK